MELIVGQKDPDLQALSPEGMVLKLSDFRGKRVILTTSTNLFQKAADDIHRLGGVCIGVNLPAKSNYRPSFYLVTTFLIDETGTLRRIWRKVRARGHLEEVVTFLNTLSELKCQLPQQVFSPGVI